MGHCQLVEFFPYIYTPIVFLSFLSNTPNPKTLKTPLLTKNKNNANNNALHTTGTHHWLLTGDLTNTIVTC